MARLVQLLNNSSWIVILLFVTGCKQPGKQLIHGNFIHSIDNKLNSVNGIIFFNDKPFTGAIFSFFPGTTDTSEIANYLEGKEHGEWQKFYEHGLLKEKREFMDGKKTGEYVAWWGNGKQQLLYLFEDDEYEGTCKEWNEAGMLIKEMNYKKGHEQQTQRWWYDNGKIKANYVIKDGRRYGLLGTKNCINVSDSIFKN
jgi:antitoxin component YwqK of YwqJK toxin-antitoxin module